ncbi:MAG: nitroreductase family protein [Promethearchaeota archaeon]
MSNKEAELSPLYFYKEGMNWNPVEKIIYERRSIRVFKKDPLPDNLIRRILEAGRFAPSAGNSQPWKFLVIKSPEIIAEMEKDALKMAQKFMRLLDYSKKKSRRRLAKMVIKRKINELAPQPFGALQTIAAEKVPIFYNPPVIICIASDRRGASNPKVDIGIAGQNMVLTAHSLGVATCWIGMIKLLLHPLAGKIKRKWKKFFNIKYPYELTEAISLGWPKGKYDGEVPREVQLTEWYEGGMNDPPRIEEQGV